MKRATIRNYKEKFEAVYVYVSMEQLESMGFSEEMAAQALAANIVVEEIVQYTIRCSIILLVQSWLTMYSQDGGTYDFFIQRWSPSHVFNCQPRLYT